jgi:hypothetical protein
MVISSETNFVVAGDPISRVCVVLHLQSPDTASTCSTSVDPEPIVPLSKAVVRTVTSLILSLPPDLIFSIAFPAYIGRVNVSPAASTAMISAIYHQQGFGIKPTIEVSRAPARRGKTFLPTAVCAAKRWVMDLEGKNLAKTGVTSEAVGSGREGPWTEYRIERGG